MIQETIAKCLGIVKAPAGFFAALAENESSLIPAWKYFWVLMVPVVSLSFVMNMLIPFAGFVTINNMGSQPGTVGLLIGHGFAYVMFPLMMFVLVGLYFVMLNMMGLMFHFRLTYTQTFQIVVYGGTPACLMGNFPYIEYLGSLWSVVVIVIGIKTLGETSTGVAVTALLAPVVVFVGCGYAVLSSVMGLL